MIALKEMGKKLADMSTKGLHHQRFRPIIAPLAFGSMVFLGTRANSWAAERTGKVEPLIEGLGGLAAGQSCHTDAEVLPAPRVFTPKYLECRGARRLRFQACRWKSTSASRHPSNTALG